MAQPNQELITSKLQCTHCRNENVEYLMIFPTIPHDGINAANVSPIHTTIMPFKEGDNYVNTATQLFDYRCSDCLGETRFFITMAAKQSEPDEMVDLMMSFLAREFIYRSNVLLPEYSQYIERAVDGSLLNSDVYIATSQGFAVDPHKPLNLEGFIEHSVWQMNYQLLKGLKLI